VHVEGIRHLAQCDTFYTRDLGYRIKLLAVIRQTGQEVEVRVHPTLVPLNRMLASVNGVFNAVMVRGDLTGETVFYGRGAGADATASTVIGDVGDIVRNLAAGRPRHAPVVPLAGAGLRLRRMADIETRYYLRLALRDQPGVLARIATILGDHSISIASVMQKEIAAADHVPVIIVTHRARE
jgi:homoserine dehydrogenase